MSVGMSLLIPIDITSYTTNVPETDYPEYVPATSYSIGVRVIIASTHSVYESLQNINAGHAPATSPTWWVYVGATNAYKAVDPKVSTQTVNNTSMTFEFPTLKANTIAFLNMQCESITVELLEGATVIFSETRNGYTRDTAGWYSYLFGDFTYKNFFLFEHPYNPTAIYRITLTGATCKLGVMVRGTMFYIGKTPWGLEKGFIDYSKTDFDQWGESYLKQGNVRDFMNSTIKIDTPRNPIVEKVLKERRGKLSLYVPANGLYDLAVYGFLREPKLIYSNPVISESTFDIQGVI